jgi:hypothetical protein
MAKDHSKNYTLLAAAVCLVALPTLAGAASVAGHRAFYEMRIGESDNNASVQSVSGRSAFLLERDCDGWRSAEDYLIEFGNPEGRVDRIISHFESWEADSGDKYSFDIAEKSSFEDDKDFGGFAQIDGANGKAVFSVAPDSSIALSGDTYFPIRHMHAIIEKANRGEKILAASVFTGAEPDDALLTTNTVIGGWQETASTVDLGGLGVDGFWPVQIAYFKPSATAVEPEYEIQFWLQPNGVIRQYEIDYGDFSIIASLMDIEAVEAPICS